MTSQSNFPAEVVLKGGRANTGNVVRIGDQVARPRYPQTASVDHFLEHLVAAGISFVPRPLGTDDQHRQRLTFIEGTAPTPPYPDWAFDEALLIEVAQHQRVLHEAARSYVPLPDSPWAVSAGDYFPAKALVSDQPIVCHNDLGMTNAIVNQDHRLVGLIDFDYCRPVDPLFDIAVAVRHWAPFGDLDMQAGQNLDRVRRFGLFCDVHELVASDRAHVVQFAVAFLDQARQNIQALAAAGGVGFQALLDNGYEQTNLRTVAWLTEHTETLTQT